MRDLVRFASIDREERVLFLHGILLMEVTQFALWALPVRRVTRWLNAIEDRYKSNENSPSIGARRAARRLSQAAKFCPIPTACLAQTLAAKVLMSRCGYDSTVRIGVSKSGGGLNAHAWLECPGGVTIGNPTPESKRYVPLEGAERLAG
jgi:hypothetical protein